MKERGSALLTVVTTIVVLLLISGIFFKMVISNSKLETSEEKGLKAYYLAEAGIQYGIAEVLNKNIKKGDPLPSPETVSNPFGQGGRFSVNWQDNDSSFMVTSTGDYQGVIRKKAAEYLYPLPDYPLWNPSNFYKPGDDVLYNGQRYQAKHPSQNEPPDQSDAWKVIS